MAKKKPTPMDDTPEPEPMPEAPQAPPEPEPEPEPSPSAPEHGVEPPPFFQLDDGRYQESDWDHRRVILINEQTYEVVDEAPDGRWIYARS